jgi:rhodanese-related sulfurtransferase
MHAIASIAIVAAAATLGDFIWYTFGVRHTMAAGVVHGALLLTTVGAALGAASGRLWAGLPIGALAGIGGALSYYLLVVIVDSRTYGSAIPAAWIVMWLLLATLDGRWLRAPQRRSWTEVAARGLAAAILGGLAFALVRNTLWGRPAGDERSYLLQFAAWAVAWAPGMLALLWEGDAGRRSGRDRRPQGPAASHGETDSADPVPPISISDTAASSISPTEMSGRIDRGDKLHILDVRTHAEFASGHVPGAVNIPFQQVPSRLAEVPGAPDDELFLYCGHGPRAYLAAVALRRGGRARIVYISGHFAGWQSAGLRVER